MNIAVVSNLVVMAALVGLSILIVWLSGRD